MNLPSLTRLNEKYMKDECTVKRDPQLETDDTWNDTTGEYTPPVGDKDTVYSGKCMFYTDRMFRDNEKGGAYDNVSGYWLEIPKTVTDLKPEDEVKCTVCPGDPGMVDRVFYLDTMESETFATARRMRIHDRQRRPGG